MTPHQQTQEKILKLQEAITSAHPQMPVLLRDIHTVLLKDPEQVTLLTEDEIAIVFAGLKKQTQVVFAEKAAAKPRAGAKRASSMSLDDL